MDSCDLFFWKILRNSRINPGRQAPEWPIKACGQLNIDELTTTMNVVQTFGLNGTSSIVEYISGVAVVEKQIKSLSRSIPYGRISNALGRSNVKNKFPLMSSSCVDCNMSSFQQQFFICSPNILFRWQTCPLLTCVPLSSTSFRPSIPLCMTPKPVVVIFHPIVTLLTAQKHRAIESQSQQRLSIRLLRLILSVCRPSSPCTLYVYLMCWVMVMAMWRIGRQ